MHSTPGDDTQQQDRYELVVASRDREFIATVQTLAAGLPIRVHATDNPDNAQTESERGTAAVVLDRRTMLGLGGSVIGRPTPAPPVLCVLDGAEGAALEALRRGAWEVITPPFEARDLQRLLEPLVAEGVRRCRDREIIHDFYDRIGSLTPPENEVMEAVCEGKLNKQIARELNVSIRTVEQRRRRVFNKMDVPSAVPLACRVVEVRTIERLSRPASIGPTRPDSPGPNPPAPVLTVSPTVFGPAQVNQPC